MFAELNQLWDPLKMNHFAPRVSAKLPRFYSYRPDPQAEVGHPFPQDWNPEKEYALPPFAFLGRYLERVRKFQWKAQSWYPSLLEMCVAPPFIFPRCPGLLKRPASRRLLSGNLTQRRELQKGLTSGSSTEEGNFSCLYICLREVG